MKAKYRLLVAAALAFVAHAAISHAKVIDAEPKDGATLATAPGELRLKFNEPVELGFTRIKLLGPDGKEVAVGKPQAADADTSAILLTLPALPSGVYKAQWSAVGHDGHRTKGGLAFTVK